MRAWAPAIRSNRSPSRPSLSFNFIIWLSQVWATLRLRSPAAITRNTPSCAKNCRNPFGDRVVERLVPGVQPDLPVGGGADHEEGRGGQGSRIFCAAARPQARAIIANSGQSRLRPFASSKDAPPTGLLRHPAWSVSSPARFASCRTPRIERPKRSFSSEARTRDAATT